MVVPWYMHAHSHAHALAHPTDVYVASAVRTPIGGFNGSLAAMRAVDLGVVAIKGVSGRVYLMAIEHHQ